MTMMTTYLRIFSGYLLNDGEGVVMGIALWWRSDVWGFVEGRNGVTG